MVSNTQLSLPATHCLYILYSDFRKGGGGWGGGKPERSLEGKYQHD
jgi:hypothetical protein